MDITLEEIRENLTFLNKIYDIVRLVDPVRKCVLEKEENNLHDTPQVCFDYWKTDKICDNCISMRSYLEKKTFMKLEKHPDSIMLVTSIMLDSFERPVVLELLKNVTDSMLIGTGVYEKGLPAEIVTEELQNMAVRDSLTSLYNRRFIDERMTADIVRAAVEKSKLTVILADIDDMKKINDQFGHLAGDKSLKKTGEVLVSSIRSGIDWAARYGGDEFLVCLNGTDAETGYLIAERMRKKIEKMSFTVASRKVKFTVSFGVYMLEDGNGTVEDIIDMADRNMYKAKNRGKNRTVSSEK